MTPAQTAFVAWLQQNQPSLYKAASSRQGTIGGFLDSVTAIFNKVVDAAPAVLTKYVDGKQQLALVKYNIERAKQGLLPIDSASYDPAYGYSMQQTNYTPWIIGGAALLAVLLITSKR